MKKLLIMAFCAFFCLSGMAQDRYPNMFGRDEFKAAEFTDHHGTTLKYRYLEPLNAKDGKKYPLVLFLHGAGERGSDNELQLKNGAGQFINPVNREKYPAYVLLPQCPAGQTWAYDEVFSREPFNMPEQDETVLVHALKQLVDSYVATGKIDTRRIYVTGLSMGGMATFDLVVRYPDFFAAAVPICGSVYPPRLTSAIKTKFRLFHGDADDSVPVAGSREAYKALKAAGVSVEYFEIPDCKHNSWTPAYRRSDFLEWMFAQKKKK